MDMADIKKLDTVQRLRIMEALWESLLYEEDEIESPDWHEAIVEERKTRIKEGKAKFIALADLKATRK